MILCHTLLGSTREIYKRKLIALRSNLDQKVQPKVLPPSTTVPNVRLTGEGDLEQVYRNFATLLY